MTFPLRRIQLDGSRHLQSEHKEWFEQRTKKISSGWRRPMRTFMLAMAMIVFVTGCGGTMGGGGSASSQPDGAASGKGEALAGTWRGVFEQVQTGDSGRIHGGI